MTRTLRTALAAVMTIGVASCADQPLGAPMDGTPVPGSFTVVLSSEQPVGAVVVRLFADALTAPAATDDETWLFTRNLDDTGREFEVAVVGTELMDRVFTFDVADIRRIEEYSVELVEVADLSSNLMELRDISVSLVAEAADTATPQRIADEM